MNRKIKGRKKEIQLSIDEDLEIIFYSFTPLVPKVTGGNMNLTPQDIAAIQLALQPQFDKLDTKIDDVETRLITKIDALSERIDNIVKKNYLSE